MRKRCSFRLDMLVRAAAGGGALAAANASSGGAADPYPNPNKAAGGAAGALGPGAPGPDVVMNGTLASGNCGLSLRLDAATTHIQAYFAKAVNYTLMITALSFVQVPYTLYSETLSQAYFVKVVNNTLMVTRAVVRAGAAAACIRACTQPPARQLCFLLVQAVCMIAVHSRRSCL